MPKVDDKPLLFCPFCRECFEGERTCPEHELDLVAFDALPKERHVARDDEPLGVLELGYGRGLSFAGAIFALVGFVLPSFTFTALGTVVTKSAWEFASSRALVLFTVPLAAFVVLAILYRRKTPLALRGARLIAPLIGLMPLVSIGYVVWRVARIVAMSAHSDPTASLAPAVGAYVIGLGSVLMLVGGIRLGVAPRSAVTPHGASPEGENGRIVVDE